MYRVIENRSQEKNGRPCWRGRLLQATPKRQLASHPPQFRQEIKSGARERVLPCVRHHSRTQALPKMSEQAKHGSVNSEENHPPGTLVTMCCAENDRGEDYAHVRVACDRSHLPLQVSTKNNFLDHPDENHKHEESQKLARSLRADAAYRLLSLVDLLAGTFWIQTRQPQRQ